MFINVIEILKKGFYNKESQKILDMNTGQLSVESDEEFKALVGLSLEDKVKRASSIVAKASHDYSRIAVANSGGKDSMVVVHLARQVDPAMKIFAIVTPFKPKETFEYHKWMNEKMNLDMTVYYAGEQVPEEFKAMNVVLLPELAKKHKKYTEEIGDSFTRVGQEPLPLYKTAPSLCCDLLKTEPTKEAVKDLDAWVCGLRNTEGRTRKDYKEVEARGQGLVKINPILIFTESDVWEYMKRNNIEPHPWYAKVFDDGRAYRSLGCAPCTEPILPDQEERAGRWIGTSKCGGECGIHTQPLKSVTASK